MSPTNHDRSSRAGVMRCAVPPQSTHVMVSRGCSAREECASGSSLTDSVNHAAHRNSVERMRVVAGTLRGRRIESPEGTTTRPTTDMAREAIFNSLGSQYDLTDARIVDAFAGTGALGIEALSRGAGHVTFIERDKAALDVLRENLQTLGLVDRSTVLRGDALTQVGQCRDATLVLADPPYDFAKWPEFLAAVPCDVVVAEAGAPVAAPAGWEVAREKRYGRTHVTFLRRVR